MPVIGFLNAASRDQFDHLVRAFHLGLNERGYVEGRNVAIEYRWADNQYDRLPGLAEDLVHRRATVITTGSATLAALAAKAATTTIPIVFLTVSDPVELGFVTSLNRPGGNLTGVTTLNVEMGPKRLEVLHELLPAATIVGALVNPINYSVVIEAEMNGSRRRPAPSGSSRFISSRRAPNAISMMPSLQARAMAFARCASSRLKETLSPGSS